MKAKSLLPRYRRTCNAHRTDVGRVNFVDFQLNQAAPEGLELSRSLAREDDVLAVRVAEPVDLHAIGAVIIAKYIAIAIVVKNIVFYITPIGSSAARTVYCGIPVKEKSACRVVRQALWVRYAVAVRGA